MNIDSESREVAIERKNRRLATILTVFAIGLMTASYVLMKIFHYVPTPPK